MHSRQQPDRGIWEQAQAEADKDSVMLRPAVGYMFTYIMLLILVLPSNDVQVAHQQIIQGIGKLLALASAVLPQLGTGNCAAVHVCMVLLLFGLKQVLSCRVLCIAMHGVQYWLRILLFITCIWVSFLECGVFDHQSLSYPACSMQHFCNITAIATTHLVAMNALHAYSCTDTVVLVPSACPLRMAYRPAAACFALEHVIMNEVTLG